VPLTAAMGFGIALEGLEGTAGVEVLSGLGMVDLTGGGGRSSASLGDDRHRPTGSIRSSLRSPSATPRI